MKVCMYGKQDNQYYVKKVCYGGRNNQRYFVNCYFSTTLCLWKYIFSWFKQNFCNFLLFLTPFLPLSFSLEPPLTRLSMDPQLPTCSRKCILSEMPPIRSASVQGNGNFPPSSWNALVCRFTDQVSIICNPHSITTGQLFLSLLCLPQC